MADSTPPPPRSGPPRSASAPRAIPVAIVGRHVHLSASHLEALFGPGAKLHALVQLTQPGEYASTFTVEVRGPQGSLAHVRVCGPTRPRTVVELPQKDLVRLGVAAPAKATAKVDGSPGCVLGGPKGTVVLAEGLLIAGRHLHAAPHEAAALGLADDQLVALHVVGERARVLRDVPVRVREGARLELHVDLDDANSLDVSAATTATLLGRGDRPRGLLSGAGGGEDGDDDVDPRDAERDATRA